MKRISYLGVDIGSSGIKLVELMSVNGVPELVTYGHAEYPLPSISQGNLTVSAREISATIRAVGKKANIHSNRAYSVLPTDSVFSSVINIPKLNKKQERSDAILKEAEKLLPMPVEQMTLDPQILDTSTVKGIDQVLLVAAPKKMVQQYLDIFKGAGMELVGVETESFALTRALVGRDKSPMAIIDMGSNTTDIIVVMDGVPRLARSIGLGGHQVTMSYAKHLGVEIEAAEQMKRDVGLQTGGRGELPAIAIETVEPVLNEIRFSLDLFTKQTGKSVEKVILAGGSSLLSGLSDHLAKVVKTRVYIGDPWARVRYPLELKGVLQNMAPGYSVAIGAALQPLK
jgi:type IV pilus assembly protein PilM